MLKKIEPSKKKYFNKKSRTFFKSFPKSNKIYINGKIYKDLKVGMRNIDLDDKENKNLTVYDT